MPRIPYNKQSGMRIQSFTEQEITIAESRINGGMVTRFDPADIENNQLSVADNVTLRYDVVTQRLPNSNLGAFYATPILMLALYEGTGGHAIIIGTTTGVKLRLGTGTQNITGVLTAGTYDYFKYAYIGGRFFIADNGADPIQEINFVANTIAALGNAPNYKFICSFNNRILGANLAGIAPNTNQVGWSGNLNFAEWNSLVDPSAGFTPLIDNTSNTNDDISGIFGFDEVALLLREKSLWGIGKQPIASNPFNFFVLHPNIGCDCPHTAVAIRNGICWYDSRTNSVYTYQVGDAAPKSIGDAITNLLIPTSQFGIREKLLATGSYDPANDEYVLVIPSRTSTLTIVWTYNFKTQAWARNYYFNTTLVAHLDFIASFQFNWIDLLQGTIDQLSGTIDELVNSIALPSSTIRYFGNSDGSVEAEDIALNGTTNAYSGEIHSKIFRLPKNVEYVTGLAFDFIALSQNNGGVRVSYSKDGGTTWILYKAASTGFFDYLTRKRVLIKKQIRCAEFMWRIVFTSANAPIAITNYEVYVVPSKSDTISR